VKPLRILIVSHPPLNRGAGAAQTALDFRNALAERGHDAVAWSPEPLAPGRLGWNHWLLQRLALERFLAAAASFDVIDVPPISISTVVQDAAPLVVGRSIQPDFLYLRSSLRTAWSQGLRRVPRAVVYWLASIPLRAALGAGWRRAGLALCLGSRELEWMRDKFPGLRRRLHSYYTAPSPGERPSLRAVAAARRPQPNQAPLRWLWIGRWVSHKGVAELKRLLQQRMQETSDCVTVAGCGNVPHGELDASWQATGRLQVIPSFVRSELPALLAAHDAGLFTSEVEGWGLSVQEMLESGMPVFATDAGCAPDVAPHVVRGLHPLPPPVKLAGGLAVELMESYWECFDWGRIASEYEDAVMSHLPSARKGLRRPGSRRSRA